MSSWNRSIKRAMEVLNPTTSHIVLVSINVLLWGNVFVSSPRVLFA